MHPLLADALRFLDEREPVWGVTLSRRGFLFDLADRVADPKLGLELQGEIYNLTDEELAPKRKPA